MRFVVKVLHQYTMEYMVEAESRDEAKSNYTTGILQHGTSALVKRISAFPIRESKPGYLTSGVEPVVYAPVNNLRNMDMFADYKAGMKPKMLHEKYKLSRSRIAQICWREERRVQEAERRAVAKRQCVTNNLLVRYMNLSPRAINAVLNALGPDVTLGDLLNHGPMQLLRFPNLGRRSLGEIVSALNDAGYTYDTEWKPKLNL